jgi:hypothetical protein
MQYQPSLNADRIEDFRELLTGNRTTLHVSVNFLAKPAFFARDRGTMIRREEIKRRLREVCGSLAGFTRLSRER